MSRPPCLPPAGLRAGHAGGHGAVLPARRRGLGRRRVPGGRRHAGQGEQLPWAHMEQEGLAAQAHRALLCHPQHAVWGGADPQRQPLRPSPATTASTHAPSARTASPSAGSCAPWPACARRAWSASGRCSSPGAWSSSCTRPSLTTTSALSSPAAAATTGAPLGWAGLPTWERAAAPMQGTPGFADTTEQMPNARAHFAAPASPQGTRRLALDRRHLTSCAHAVPRPHTRQRSPHPFLHTPHLYTRRHERCIPDLVRVCLAACPETQCLRLTVPQHLPSIVKQLAQAIDASPSPSYGGAAPAPAPPAPPPPPLFQLHTLKLNVARFYPAIADAFLELVGKLLPANIRRVHLHVMTALPHVLLDLVQRARPRHALELGLAVGGRRWSWRPGRWSCRATRGCRGSCGRRPGSTRPGSRSSLPTRARGCAGAFCPSDASGAGRSHLDHSWQAFQRGQA